MTHFTTAQREALVELLCLAAATNHRESPVQEVAMHRALQKLKWGEEPSMLMPVFLVRALQEARDIVDDEKCVVAFIADRTAHFTTESEQARVIDLLMLVIEIDGMEESEDVFIARVRAAFGE
jgi:hypothetical protein